MLLNACGVENQQYNQVHGGPCLRYFPAQLASLVFDARAIRREGVGGALSAVRRAFADAPKTYGCAALLVSVLGICLALVAALASAPIKRHPGSTKRKSE